MLIEAHVGRDDGTRGLALYFDWLAPDSLERLRRLIDTLQRSRQITKDPITRSCS